MATRWPRPQPRLRTDAEQRQERGAAWPELVYDLVYVVAIAALATRLEGEIGWHDVARSGLLLVPVWWVWMGVTLAGNRFDAGPIALPIVTFLNLLAAAALALTVGEATGERAAGFTLAYVAARALAIALWLRAGRREPAVRPLAGRMVAGSSAALVPWLLSLAVPVPARYGLWAFGLAIDLLTPWATLTIWARLPRLNAAHLSERYRLFTIIVLGEAVAGAIRAAGEAERLPLLSGALALALAFGLGWAAFDGPLRVHAPPGARGTARGYLLLPLVAGLTALGSGITDAIAHGDAPPTDAARWLLCGATAVSLAALAALDLLPGSPPANGSLPALRVGAAAAALLIGALGGGLDAVGLLALLALVVAGQTLLGATLLGRSAAADSSELPA